MSLEALVVLALICGVIAAAIGFDQGRGVQKGYLMLFRLDELVINALARLWRSD